MGSKNRYEYFVTDRANHRIKKYRANFSNLSCEQIAEDGGFGSGDGDWNTPSGICVDDKFVYTTEIGNNRIKKLKRSDLSFVAKIGSVGSGDDNFNSPNDITSDGVFVFITDYTNERLHKRKCSDLSLVSIVNSVGRLRGICNDGTNLYATTADSFHILKFDFDLVNTVNSNSFSSNVSGICVDNEFLWTVEPSTGNIFVHVKADTRISAAPRTGTHSSSNYSITRGFNEIITLSSSLDLVNGASNYLYKGSITNFDIITVRNGDEGSGLCEFGSMSQGYGYCSFEFERYVKNKRALNSTKVHHRTLDGALYSYTL